MFYEQTSCFAFKNKIKKSAAYVLTTVIEQPICKGFPAPIDIILKTGHPSMAEYARLKLYLASGIGADREPWRFVPR